MSAVSRTIDRVWAGSSSGAGWSSSASAGTGSADPLTRPSGWYWPRDSGTVRGSGNGTGLRPGRSAIRQIRGRHNGDSPERQDRGVRCAFDFLPSGGGEKPAPSLPSRQSARPHLDEKGSTPCASASLAGQDVHGADGCRNSPVSEIRGVLAGCRPFSPVALPHHQRLFVAVGRHNPATGRSTEPRRIRDDANCCRRASRCPATLRLQRGQHRRRRGRQDGRRHLGGQAKGLPPSPVARSPRQQLDPRRG